MANSAFLKFPRFDSCMQPPELHVLAGRNPEPHGGFASPDRHIEAGGRIRYFGRSCLVLQTPEGAVATDPFISADSGARDRYTPEDLPDFIDLVLVTDGHQEYILLEMLLQLRGRIGMIVAPRSARGDPEGSAIGPYLSRLGFPVVEADDYDEFTFPGGRVLTTPFMGERGDLNARGKSTYWVELAGRSAFIGADSSGIDTAPYRHLRQRLGAADYAFLGIERDSAPLIWPYRSNSRTARGSNAEQAVAIILELEADEAYAHLVGEDPWPGRFLAGVYDEDTYQLGQIDEFITWCADYGIRAGHLSGQHACRW
jgi:L-ascorbate metabolism protein UlaG (beta-lactamase superfamily)